MKSKNNKTMEEKPLIKEFVTKEEMYNYFDHLCKKEINDTRHTVRKDSTCDIKITENGYESRLQIETLHYLAFYKTIKESKYTNGVWNCKFFIKLDFALRTNKTIDTTGYIPLIQKRIDDFLKEKKR